MRNQWTLGLCGLAASIACSMTLWGQEGQQPSGNNLPEDLPQQVAQREQAIVLWRSIQLAKEAVAKSARPLTADSLREHIKRLVKQQPAARMDYVQFFDPENFSPTKTVTHGTHMALAVFVGKTRLIDNARL